jgi:lipocalin
MIGNDQKFVGENKDTIKNNGTIQKELTSEHVGKAVVVEHSENSTFKVKFLAVNIF